MTDLISITSRLVQKYGINLLSNEGRDTYGSYLDFQPTDLEKTEGFIIRMRIGWRSIESEFIPGNYAGKLINTMGIASLEKKTLFRSLLISGKELDSNVGMKINDLPVNPLEYTEWPSDWQSLSLTIRKSPVAIDETDTSEMEEMILMCGGQLLALVLSLLPFEQIELQDGYPGLPEGMKARVEVNRYERNHLNRSACIQVYGPRCSVCGFDFVEYYGEIGHGYIQVHHVIPVSQLGENYIVDPIADLRPVCPNCHAMLHRKDPPYSITELRDMINK